jgi:hypothetical protein
MRMSFLRSPFRVMTLRVIHSPLYSLAKKQTPPPEIACNKTQAHEFHLCSLLPSAERERIEKSLVRFQDAAGTPSLLVMNGGEIMVGSGQLRKVCVLLDDMRDVPRSCHCRQRLSEQFVCDRISMTKDVSRRF